MEHLNQYARIASRCGAVRIDLAVHDEETIKITYTVGTITRWRRFVNKLLSLVGRQRYYEPYRWVEYTHRRE